MDPKLTPLQAVAIELAEHCSLTRQQIERALSDVLDHLMIRAKMEIEDFPDSYQTAEIARQYHAVSELILYLGTSLIAVDDIEQFEGQRSDRYEYDETIN